MREDTYTEEQIEEFAESFISGMYIDVTDNDSHEELLDKLEKLTGVQGEIVVKYGRIFVKSIIED